VLQHLLRTALDAPGHKEAAGLAHHLQHFLVHVVHAAVAGPVHVNLLIDHQLAQTHHLLARCGEQIRVHIHVIDAQLLEHPQLFHDLLGRAQAHRKLVIHMLDAVDAARRAAAAGDNKRKRALHQRHAVLIIRQQVVQRDGQIIQIFNERPGRVYNGLTAIAPHQALDPVHVHRTVLVEGRPVGGVVLVDHLADEVRALVQLALQVVQQVADRQVRLAAQDHIQAGVGFHRLQRDGRDVRAKRNRLCPARAGQERAIHVVLQRRRGHLGQVIFGLVLVDQFGKFFPAHTLRIGIDDLDFIRGHQHGAHLRQ